MRDPLGARRQRRGEHEERNDAERQVHVEDPAPAKRGRQEPPEQRTGDAREAEHRAEQARVAATFARRDHVADRGLGTYHQPAASETLQRAERDQLVEVLAQPAERGAEQEDHERALEDDLAPVLVAELPVQRRYHRLREQVGGDDPGDVVQATEVADDRRERGGNDRLVERRQEHDEQQPAEDESKVDLRLCWIRGRGARDRRAHRVPFVRLERMLCVRPMAAGH